eukprot:scaffold216_cov340-Prasinococcus_capsulatus_cf.AAC.2
MCVWAARCFPPSEPTREEVEPPVLRPFTQPKAAPRLPVSKAGLGSRNKRAHRSRAAWWCRSRTNHAMAMSERGDARVGKVEESLSACVTATSDARREQFWLQMLARAAPVADTFPACTRGLGGNKQASKAAPPAGAACGALAAIWHRRAEARLDEREPPARATGRGASAARRGMGRETGGISIRLRNCHAGCPRAVNSSRRRCSRAPHHEVVHGWSA